MEKGPVLVVAACIVRDEFVLLARRNQPTLEEAHLKWELPGGKVKIGEAPQEALKREIREELRTDINVVRLLPHLQTNIYHRNDGSVGHFVVLAFESVLAKGATKPKPSDESVKQFEWMRRDQLMDLPLLPGTARFVECLERLDRASFDQANLYIRLERKDKSGGRMDYWEFQCVTDLWGDFSLVERYVNYKRRATENSILVKESQASIWERVTYRVRSLVRDGYVVIKSTTPLLEPLNSE